MTLGDKVTLRGRHAWVRLPRSPIHGRLPRIRDFSGVKRPFDGAGNSPWASRRSSCSARVNFDKVGRGLGHRRDHGDHAATDAEALSLSSPSLAFQPRARGMDTCKSFHGSNANSWVKAGGSLAAAAALKVRR